MGAALRRLGVEVDICVKDAPPDAILTRDFGLDTSFPVTRIATRGYGPASLRFGRGVLAGISETSVVLTRNLVTAWLTARAGHFTLLELHSPLETVRERILFRLFITRKRAIGLVTITNSLKGRFINDFGSAIAPRIEVLPDAADPLPFQTCRAPWPPKVGYVGSFLPGKGAELVLKIAALMPETKFVMVGGPDSALPQGKRPPNVSLLGRLSHVEAMRQMAGFSVALLPNQSKVLVSDGRADIGSWTSPLKLFEYMSAHRPIVASRLPVLQEVLVDGRNALLADPLDAGDWAAKIRQLLGDEVMARALADTAYQDLLSNYSWDARARRMVDILGSARQS